MIVLDTHVWLWWVSERERLSADAHSAIEAASGIGISPVSCWEVATLARRRRIALAVDVPDWIAAALSAEGIEPLPLTPSAAAAAGLLGEAFPGDPADRLIYASARERPAALVTKDARIRAFDPAGTVW